MLRGERPETQIVVAEPDNSPMLGSGIAQARAPTARRPRAIRMFRPHLMQGWSPDFIPKLTEDAVDAGLIDEIVAGERRRGAAPARASSRGRRASSAASPAARRSRRRSSRARPRRRAARILCMLPDTGERYLSTPLFEDIAEEMTEEELAISRLDAALPLRRAAAGAGGRPAAAGREPATRGAAASSSRRSAIRDQPVVMFALEWCEFCWAVRKLFARLGIAYRSVDLDSVALQEGDRGGDPRRR